MRTTLGVVIAAALGAAVIGAAQDPAPSQGPQIVVYKSPT